MNKLSRRLLVALASILLLGSASSLAQKREHLTPEEIEIVRDTQQIDKRIGVFVKAAERRLMAVAEPSANHLEKDKGSWGEVSGTPREILTDVYKILDEAVVNIDDVALRDPKSSLLGKSLSILAAGMTRFMPHLLKLRDSAQTQGERHAIENIAEKAEEIIEAAKRHRVDDKPVESEKAGKKGSKAN